MGTAVKVGARNNASDKTTIQAIHDSACDLGADCKPMDLNEGITAMINGKAINYKSMMNLGAMEYAQRESWDIVAASQALGQVAQMCQSEMAELVHLDQLSKIMLELCDYIKAEISEMNAAASQAEAEEAPSEVEPTTNITANYEGEVLFKSADKVPAQVKSTEPENDKLNLSYVKSLGIDLPINKLAVKYVGKNTIAHPVFLWGDAKKTDLETEFFNKSSDVWDKVMGTSPRPLTWEHNQDEKFSKFEKNPVIGKTVKFYDDDIARWAESVIDTDKAYRRHIDQFIEEKRLGYSSDSAPQYVTRARQKNGEWYELRPDGIWVSESGAMEKSISGATWLKMWAWFGGSLTASPCEPRMKVYTPEYIKSLGVQLPDTAKWKNYNMTSDYLKTKYQIGD